MSEQMIKHFWNDEASRWSPQNRNPLVGWYDQHNADEKEARLLFGDLDLYPETYVALEYGCGPGRNIIKFKDFFARIDGADISEEILRKVPENLTHAGLPELKPNLYLTNGHSLEGVESGIYDVVFSIICMQHIGCHAWRQELYHEFYRVLRKGGYFTFQMGFGPGHPLSVDYFHNYDETDDRHRDTRVEDESALQKDLEDAGFKNFTHVITDPCHDVHPQWIWVTVQK